MRAVLDEVKAKPIREIFPKIFNKLWKAGVVKEYRYWDSHIIVSIDGVEHFSSNEIHCEHCTTHTLRNGTISYQLSALAAIMLHPKHKEVITLDFEPILNQDGAKKNDCEGNTAKRLCASLVERYTDLKILLVEDALYANAPHIRQITNYDWLYVLNVKPDSHQSLEKQFAGRRSTKQVKELRFTDNKGIKHYFAWTNALSLCESAVDVSVNYLIYEQTDKLANLTRWTWITILVLTSRNVEKVMLAGRGRWKIENETFNTLKNQAYHFEHNYGHGYDNLASVLALLMFLAFTVDQILQSCWFLFQQVRSGLLTKAKLWHCLGSLFTVLVFPSMTSLYIHMASLYRIQLR
jgi:Transposase DDE domain